MCAISIAAVAFGLRKPVADHSSIDITDPGNAHESSANRKIADSEPAPQDTLGPTRGRTSPEAGTLNATPALIPEALPNYSSLLELDGHMGMWVQEQVESVFQGDPRDYESKLGAAEAGDAEAAFYLHILVHECRSKPRTQWQLDRWMESMQETMVQRFQNASSIPDNAFQMLDRFQREYEMCSVLGFDTNLSSESLRWLNLAADLGHMGAQRLYHARGREIIVGNNSSLAFHQPDLIADFKDRANRYVKALIELEHPQGYSLMSRMLSVGDVYEQDRLMAYAYAYATELVGEGQILEEARTRMNGGKFYLRPDQITEAERLGREIVRGD